MFHGFHKIELTVRSLLVGDFGAAAVLIAFGAVLGKVNSYMLIIMATILIIFQTLNEEIGVAVYHATDVGGSMYVHTFGALFGVSCAWMYRPKGYKKVPRSSYYNMMFSCIGTIFLWMYWPSFNGGPITGNSQHRAFVNTVLALCCSCIGVFLTSHVIRKGLFDMEDILNATLAGGVAIGTSADMNTLPFVAMIIGFFAGIISCCGFAFLSPALQKIGIHDTCGVINLHGIPGILAGTIGAIYSGVAHEDTYGSDLGVIWSERAGDDPRGRNAQGWFQAACLFTTIVIAIASGLLTGLLFNIPKIWDKPEEIYSDAQFWHLEEIDIDYGEKGDPSGHNNQVHNREDSHENLNSSRGRREESKD